MLNFYNCHKKPTRENLRTVILELSHQEVVQKRKYIANCSKEILLSGRFDQMLKPVEVILEFYKTQSWTQRGLLLVI